MQSPTTYQIVVATSYAHAFNFWLETQGIRPDVATAQDIHAARGYAVQMAAHAAHQWELVSDEAWTIAGKYRASVNDQKVLR